MAYFLFIDESGTDRKSSGFEVFGGISIEDRDIWNLIREIHELEELFFGRRYSAGEKEMKGCRLLDKITFRQASWFPPFEIKERQRMARFCLDGSIEVTKKYIATLAQVKLDFVKNLLLLLVSFKCRVFATLSDGSIKHTDNKDDAFLDRKCIYLFERFYYFLEDKGGEKNGILVFDENEKSSSQHLIHKIKRYFKSAIDGKT